MNEVKILSSLEHKNIIKLLKVNLTGQYRKADGRTKKVLYYIMKLAEFGELYDVIESTPKFPEKLARYFFKQLLEGL